MRIRSITRPDRSDLSPIMRLKSNLDVAIGAVRAGPLTENIAICG